MRTTRFTASLRRVRAEFPRHFDLEREHAPPYTRDFPSERINRKSSVLAVRESKNRSRARIIAPRHHDSFIVDRRVNTDTCPLSVLSLSLSFFFSLSSFFSFLFYRTKFVQPCRDVRAERCLSNRCSVHSADFVDHCECRGACANNSDKLATFPSLSIMILG